MTAVIEETTVLDALADLRPGCMAGHPPDLEAEYPPCEEIAVWAAKTHAPGPGLGCPFQLLLCDEHLQFYETAMTELWLSHALRAHRIACKGCGEPLRTRHSLLWDRQRIIP